LRKLTCGRRMKEGVKCSRHPHQRHLRVKSDVSQIFSTAGYWSWRTTAHTHH